MLTKKDQETKQIQCARRHILCTKSLTGSTDYISKEQLVNVQEYRSSEVMTYSSVPLNQD